MRDHPALVQPPYKTPAQTLDPRAVRDVIIAFPLHLRNFGIDDLQLPPPMVDISVDDPKVVVIDAGEWAHEGLPRL